MTSFAAAPHILSARHDADVLICGAGPAGSSLALHLAHQGRHVLLIDRAQFPREKACGEGLMPAGVAALTRLGIVIEGAAFRGVRYHYRDRTVTGEFPHHALGCGIRRSKLDAVLFNAARAHPNVEVVHAAVQAPLLGGDRILGLTADGRDYRALLSVAADGANSILRHKLGWDASKPSHRFGLRRHYRTVLEPGPHWVDVHLMPHCEVYATPLPGNEILIASLGARPSELPAELRHYQPIDAALGASPLAVRARRRVAEGCVLLGDAAGNCDPITGGGISQALLAAEILAAHLAPSFPPTLTTLEQFDRDREAMLANYRRLTAGVLALASRPGLLKPALSVLHHTPWLFSQLLGIAAGPVDGWRVAPKAAA